jgi:pimeloyl-ACP methyl ester carboxylesterase
VSRVITSRTLAGWLAGLLAGLAVAGATGAWGATRAAAAPSSAQSSAHVYVLTGLLNMSPGLDALAEKIRRAGIPASVNNHASWSALATEAIDQYKHGRLRTIMIVGHSMGGGAALDMAAELARAGVPVDLVVAIDATGSGAVPSNVRRTVNFYVEGGVGSPMTGATRSHGAIQNVRDAKATHFSIIAAHERQLLGYVLASARPHEAAKDGAPAAQAQTTSAHGPAN